MFVSRERIKEYKDRVCIYSIPLIKFLEKIFGTKLEAKSSKIYVPGDIFKTDITTIKKFLKSLYDGDGTMDNSQISYGSRSRKLTQNITYLLALLGIKCKYWERKDGMYMVTVTGKKEINKFLSFVYGKKGVEEIRRHYNAKYAMPDVSTLLRMAKEELGMSYYKDRDVPEGLIEGIINKRKRCGLIRLQRIMRYIDKKATPEFKNSEIYKSLKIISEGNLSWTKVIRKIKDKPQWMFDIETTSSSFIGGHIPLLLHNTMWVGESERKLRDIFRRAKQVAPSIILFDEIDALAPKRGIEMGARVTEQVVSQLLTEMSGIEEMEGVVIIATTNRPDIIDPALLRPGRFDRLIYVPSPDEKTRLEIFKVHTREMPLKGVSLEKLAKETDGYSGADIEALAREAALFALREDKKAKEITMKQFEKALKKIKPSITEDLTTKYQKAVDDLKKNKMDDARYIG